VVGTVATNAFTLVTTAAEFAFKLAWEIAYAIFFKPYVDAWKAVKDLVSGFFSWYAETWTNNFSGAMAWFDENFIGPIAQRWNETIRTPIGKAMEWLVKLWKDTYSGLLKELNDKFINPFNKIWADLTKAPEKFTKDVNDYFRGLLDNLTKKYETATGFVNRMFRESINYLVNSAVDKINGFIDLYNRLANTINSNSNIRLPILNTFQRKGDIEMSLAEKGAYSNAQKMALGAYVNKPTFAEIGEGADPREYVIPHHGMAAAAAGWQAGLRGNDLVAAWQSPAPSMQARSSGGLVPGSSLPIQVSINHTGEVYQLPGGRDLVRLDQVPAIVEAAVQAVRRRG
jgi:hypothetical protein